MKRHDMIVLEINLDERFPVASVFVDLHAIEHVAREVEVALDAQGCEVACYVAFAVEEQAVPVLQWRAAEVEAGIAGEMRRAEQLAIKTIRPAVNWADDAGARVAAPLKHERLTMATYIAQQLHSCRITHERPRVVEPFQHVVIT